MYKTRIIYSQRHTSDMSDEAIRRLLMDIFDIKDEKPKAEPQRMTEDLAAKLTVADSKFRNISGQVDTVCEMDDEEYNPAKAARLSGTVAKVRLDTIGLLSRVDNDTSTADMINDMVTGYNDMAQRLEDRFLSYYGLFDAADEDGEEEPDPEGEDSPEDVEEMNDAIVAAIAALRQIRDKRAKQAKK